MHRDVLRYEVRTHTRWKYELKLTLSADEAARLADWIEPALQGKERSISLPHTGQGELPGSWRLFFKTRDADNRVLLAHPGEEEWVATIALEIAVFDAFLTQLRGGGSGGLDRLGRLHPVSNLHLTHEIG